MGRSPFYIYEHWRPDMDVCFYVGKGTANRAYDMNRSRNRHHNFIRQKLAGLGMCVEVRLVGDCLTEDEAYQMEINRISFWRSAGVDLVNMNDGGLGGRNPCEELRKLYSRIHKGKTISADTRAKMSAASKGRRPSDETRRKISAAHKGKTLSPELIERMKARKISAETGAKISAAKKGVRPSEKARVAMRASWTPERRAAQALVTAERAGKMNQARTMKGRVNSAETRRKISQSNMGKKHTAEAIEAMRARVQSPETRAKIRSAWTPERRAAQARRAAKIGCRNRKLVPLGVIVGMES